MNHRHTLEVLQTGGSLHLSCGISSSEVYLAKYEEEKAHT
jgi:hypothetical protein